MGRAARALVLAVAGGFAAGCAAGGGGKSVLDLTWGWGWNSSGAASAGVYAEPGRTPVEKERMLDYYRSVVRETDEAGAPVRPVDQIRFEADAVSNAPTGKEAAKVSFVDAAGNPVRLEDYRGKSDVVLVFTRGFPGYICPLCATYTAQITARYPEIRAAGAEVLLVFPGDPDKVKDFVKAAREIVELDGPGALPFPVLLDVELLNVDRFGIRGDLSKPATYVLDREGTVRFAFVGDQPHERPDVDTILREVRRLEGK